MGLTLTDKWVWDFWFAKENGSTHVFYLQADRALHNPDLRHWNVSIGHAISEDLEHWEILPDALAPTGSVLDGNNRESWDSLTTWTGSIIRHNQRWYMFYTGTKQSESGLIQRIGYATSTDLLNWTKNLSNPVLEADPRWYELLDLDVWFDQAWRDPWIFQDPKDNTFHAYITARANSGTPDGRAVIAHAQSTDLKTWDVLPPVTTPGNFGQMEVPQLVAIQGRYYLLFSTGASHFSSAHIKSLQSQTPVTGTHYLVADDPFGPFHYLSDTFFVGDRCGSLYSGKLIQGSDQQWYFMGFENIREEGGFIGSLSDPFPVIVQPNGELTLVTDLK